MRRGRPRPASAEQDVPVLRSPGCLGEQEHRRGQRTASRVLLRQGRELVVVGVGSDRRGESARRGQPQVESGQHRRDAGGLLGGGGQLGAQRGVVGSVIHPRVRTRPVEQRPVVLQRVGEDRGRSRVRLRGGAAGSPCHAAVRASVASASPARAPSSRSSSSSPGGPGQVDDAAMTRRRRGRQAATARQRRGSPGRPRADLALRWRAGQGLDGFLEPQSAALCCSVSCRDGFGVSGFAVLSHA